jgi:hypothetical protein
MRINLLLVGFALFTQVPTNLLGQIVDSDVSPEISISLDEGKVNISINLNEPFRWEGARFESIEKFPQPWIGLSDLPHEIWFENGDVMTWRQTDMMFIGNYKILGDPSDHEIETSVLGYLVELIGVFNSETNLLKFDSLDYALFYKTPKLIIEQSSDMVNWTKLKLSDPLPNEYKWPLGLSVNLNVQLDMDSFYRVKVNRN